MSIYKNLAKFCKTEKREKKGCDFSANNLVPREYEMK